MQRFFCGQQRSALPQFCFTMAVASLGLAAGFTAAGCSTKSKTSEKVAATESAPSGAEPNAIGLPLDQIVDNLVDSGVTLQRGLNGSVQEAYAFQVDVTDELAERIAQIETLVKLTIKQSSMTLAGWQSLGRLRNLQQLDLRDCPLNNEQLAAVLAGTPKLRALRLSGKSGDTTVDDAGLSAVSGCPELKVLMVDHLWISEKCLEPLAGNQKLAELYLAGTLVDDSAMTAIAKLPAIKKLRLAQTTVGAAGLEKLSVLALEELDISECSQIADDAMVWVGSLRSLQRLNLWRDAITDEGVSKLAELTELRWLNLDNTQLSDAALVHLKNMSRLEFLHLGSTGVSDVGMPDLLELKSLKDLIVTRTAVTDTGVKIVKDRLPNVNIQLEYVASE